MIVSRKTKFALIWALLCLLFIPVLNAGLTIAIKLAFDLEGYDNTYRFGFAKIVWA